jgi:secreted trypsin-like serine protease
VEVDMTDSAAAGAPAGEPAAARYRRGRVVPVHVRPVRVLPVLLALVAGLVSAAPAEASGSGPAGFRGAAEAGFGTRIVGGSPVRNGRYEFQAALLAQPFGDDDVDRQYCGGSLVSPVHVLTAAHCVDFVGDEPDDDVALSELRVVVGRTVLPSSQGEKRRASAIDIHPKWDPDTFRFDAAVITLARPVKGIRPVEVVAPGTDAFEQPGAEVTATGWGNTIAQPVGPGSGDASFPRRLQQVRLPVVDDAECATAYTSDGTQFLDVATMMCAGRTGKDTCQGDSGGPLFAKAAKGAAPLQIGVTSWGAGCAAAGFPGVYTRLSNAEIGDFVSTATDDGDEDDDDDED